MDEYREITEARESLLRFLEYHRVWWSEVLGQAHRFPTTLLTTFSTHEGVRKLRELLELCDKLASLVENRAFRYELDRHVFSSLNWLFPLAAERGFVDELERFLSGRKTFKRFISEVFVQYVKKDIPRLDGDLYIFFKGKYDQEGDPATKKVWERLMYGDEHLFLDTLKKGFDEIENLLQFEGFGRGRGREVGEKVCKAILDFLYSRGYNLGAINPKLEGVKAVFYNWRTLVALAPQGENPKFKGKPFLGYQVHVVMRPEGIVSFLAGQAFAGELGERLDAAIEKLSSAWDEVKRAVRGGDPANAARSYVKAWKNLIATLDDIEKNYQVGLWGERLRDYLLNILLLKKVFSEYPEEDIVEAVKWHIVFRRMRTPEAITMGGGGALIQNILRGLRDKVKELESLVLNFLPQMPSVEREKLVANITLSRHFTTTPFKEMKISPSPELEEDIKKMLASGKVSRRLREFLQKVKDSVPSPLFPNIPAEGLLNVPLTPIQKGDSPESTLFLTREENVGELEKWRLEALNDLVSQVRTYLPGVTEGVLERVLGEECFKPITPAAIVPLQKETYRGIMTARYAVLTLKELQKVATLLNVDIKAVVHEVARRQGVEREEVSGLVGKLERVRNIIASIVLDIERLIMSIHNGGTVLSAICADPDISKEFKNMAEVFKGWGKRLVWEEWLERWRSKVEMFKMAVAHHWGKELLRKVLCRVSPS